MAPLKALVEQVARLDVPRRVDFFVGARSADGFYDLDALRALEQQHPWLHVVLVATRRRTSTATSSGARWWTSSCRAGRGAAGTSTSAVRRRTCGRSSRRSWSARVPEKRIKVEEFTPNSWTPSDAEGARSA